MEGFKYTPKELALDLINELGSEEKALERIKNFKLKCLIEGNADKYKSVMEVEAEIQKDLTALKQINI